MTPSKKLLLLALSIFLWSNPLKAVNYTVNNNGWANAGAATTGDLLYCLNAANALGGPHTISFTNAMVINATGTVLLAREISLDGSTIPTYGAGGRVEIVNSGGGAAVEVNAAGANSSIIGLVVRNSPTWGMFINGSGNVTVQGCYIGTTVNGTVAAPNTFHGIHLNNSDGCVIGGDRTLGEGNIISGNTQAGIQIENSDNTVIEGNYIGVGPNSEVLGNGQQGVRILGTSENTRIGGGSAGTRNIISGNNQNGIRIEGGTHQVIGNYIGTNIAGNTAVANGENGINIVAGGPNIQIGGVAAGEGNVISGNTEIGLRSDNTTDLEVYGNIIGLDANGLNNVANLVDGIYGRENEHDHVIGGNTTGHRNVISGNGRHGIFYEEGCNNLGIYGNYIGTNINSAGDRLLIGNAENGIHLNSGVVDAVIGGVAGLGNVISGNGRLYDAAGVANGKGITILNGSNNTQVLGNLIGMQADGVTPMGNRENGMLVINCTGVTVGGDNAGEGNVISGNGTMQFDADPAFNKMLPKGHGMVILNSGTFSCLGNYVGVDQTGNVAQGNIQSGLILIFSSDFTVGNTSANGGNVFGDNEEFAIHVVGGTNGTIYNNHIGVGADGTTDVGNDDGGIYILGVAGAPNATNILVGGPLANQPNIIANSKAADPRFGDGFGIGISSDGPGQGDQDLFSHNSITCNAGLGISLNFLGEQYDRLEITPGAFAPGNTAIAAPGIDPYRTSALVVTGTGSAGDEIQLFDNSCDCEGELFIGTTTVAGDGTWSATLGSPVADSSHITAIAIDGSNNTSEFTECCRVEVDSLNPDLTTMCLSESTELHIVRHVGDNFQMQTATNPAGPWTNLGAVQPRSDSTWIVTPTGTGTFYYRVIANSANWGMPVTSPPMCFDTSEVVQIVVNPTFTVSVTPTQPSCGASDGVIVVNNTNGTATFSYSNDDSVSFQASNTFNGLGAATYEIVVVDSDGCTARTSTTLTSPGGPSITDVAVNNPTDCDDDDGSITITASGSSALEYSIDGGAIYQVSNSFASLSSANNPYEIRVRYTNGTCEVADLDVNLTAEELPVITSIVPNDPTNCDDNDGSIVINATGSTGTLEYSIDGGTTYQASNTFNGLSSADNPFEIRVRYDDPLCEVSSADVNLTAPVLPVISSVVDVDPTNCDDNDGTITINATGTSGTLEYSIDGGTSYQASNAFTGLSSADNTFQIRVRYNDPMCEVSSADIDLTAPVDPTISNVAVTDPTDCDDDDGAITITANGPSGTLEYSIDGGTTYQTSNAFTALSSSGNTYEIRVRYDNGTCEVADADVDLTSEELPVITSVVPTDPTNCDDNDGSIVINATGSTGTLEYSINGGTDYQASNTFNGLTSGGSPYAIRVRYDDPLCEVSETDVTLTAPTAPVITDQTSTNPSACGVDDGTITVTATGADGTIEYSIDGGTSYQNTGVFTGLSASVAYQVMIRYDDPMCEVTGSPINLTAPSSPVISDVAVTDPTNCDDDDGTITITASGPSGTLEYSIDGGANYFASNTFTALSSSGNTYEIRVRYDNGTCEVAAADVDLVPEVEPVITSVSPTDPTDCNDDDGQIVIAATGSTGTLEYSIDGGTSYQASNTFNGLTSGGSPYAIRVRYDDPLCEVAETDVTLTAPLAPVITNEASTNPSACGVDDGTITITATGTDGTIEYSIDGGVTYQATGMFTGLSASVAYQVMIRYDDPMCEVTGSAINLTAPSSPVISNVAVVDPTDCDDDDGAITITASGPSGTLEYSIDGGANYFASNTFTALSSSGNTYEIRVRYDNGTCEVAAADVDLVPEVEPVITSVSPTDPTDCNDDDGQIVIAATGSTGTLEYSVDGGTSYQASNTFNGLTSGGSPYAIRVRYDDPLCEVAETDVTLTAPLAPVITNEASTNTSACGVDDGTITITATGTDGTIEYSIDGGVTYQATGMFTGLSASVAYQVMIRYDDPMCEVTGSAINLTAPSSPVISNVAVVDPTDCDDDDGAITITANGPSGTLEYSIDGGTTYQASNAFTALSSSGNTYEIRVRYDNGTCEVADADVNLTAEELPVIMSVVPSDPTNCDDNDGSIVINATGSTGTLEYSVDGGTSYQASNTFNGLTSGGSPYAIRVRYDDPLCEVAETDVTLTAPLVPVITNEASTNPSACGVDDGTITITATGTDGTIEYSIDGGVTYQATGMFTGLSASVAYQVMIRYDDPMCEVTGNAIILTAPESPTIDNVIDTNPSVCANDNGSIVIDASGTTGTLEYSIDGGATYQTSNSFSGLSDGDYTPAVRYTTGICQQLGVPVTLMPINPPTINLVSSTSPITCDGLEGSISIQATGDLTLDYSIDGGASFQSSGEFTGLSAGNYEPYVSYSANTCGVPDDEINLTDPIATPFAVIGNAPLCDGSSGNLIFSGLTTGTSYQVTFQNSSDNWLETGIASNGAIQIASLETAIYSDFRLIDEKNCESTFDDPVVIGEIVDTCDCPVFIPTAFSPNPDALNDSWYVEGLDCKKGAEVQVFNRYGDRVFHTQEEYTPWDGRRNGRLLPVGTYYYEVSYIDRNNDKKRFAGSLLIKY